ncbi:ferritin-like domain-containing protein [Pseudotabrizicola algicola]|uniref:Ferritin-like domain-containing protein n=1 Tax=Pseudotabrizicola algicola TaxID=2709381 RepID=A0A6B3RRM5_9RHOB|nr:ferritin-like domain-containing protein [Pseudotabrizicola algicola]NEX48784.1 ferritin-like domain-containing protein [Pseudotabrizicola algicola]
MDSPNATRGIFVAGLRNAHAMEKQALSVMQPQLDRLESYPELQGLLEKHYRETEDQLARLDQIFASLGESPSGMKDTVLGVMGSMQTMGHSIASDEVLKNHMADYMFEHFEIAAYTSLISMARSLGLTTVIPLLQQTLEEERRCAELLLDALPRVTETFLQRTEMAQ